MPEARADAVEVLPRELVVPFLAGEVRVAMLPNYPSIPDFPRIYTPGAKFGR